jgi:hypothetical protein
LQTSIAIAEKEQEFDISEEFEKIRQEAYSLYEQQKMQ